MSAIHAPLSTKSLPGTPLSCPVAGTLFGNEGLREIPVEVLARVGRKPVDHPTGAQQRILVRGTSQGADREADRLGLRPAALARPRLEPGQIRLFQVNLQRALHDPAVYAPMRYPSTSS